jgi:DsbC/DsbD-like thiol-disulfide interchange protein
MSRPIALAAALFCLAGPVLAGESAPVRSDRATMTLAADVAAVAPGQPFRIGLRQKLAPGWHTYWQNPGDAGLPPEVTLTLPEGAAAGPIQWPAPHRIPFGPLVNYGYETATLLPQPVTPPANLSPGQDFTIEAKASWLVCEQVCIPEEGAFTLTLTPPPPPCSGRPSPSCPAHPPGRPASASRTGPARCCCEARTCRRTR